MTKWARAAMLLAVPLAGCGGVLSPQGPIAAAEKTILLNSLGIMLSIVVPTILAALGVAWWFRASNTRATYTPQWEYSGRIEMVVWAIPAMVVLLLGGLDWIGSHELDPPRPIASNIPPLDIQVVALDWKWLFIYPGQNVASVNQLVLPVGTPVRFRLTSATVMNSFFVPQLGSQIYTMAGMATRLNLQADQPGSYEGRSVQFSGEGFADMHFVVQAVPRAGFDAWVARARAAGPALDDAGYASLARENTVAAPLLYRGVRPGLFEAIVDETAPAPQTPRIAPGGKTVPASGHQQG